MTQITYNKEKTSIRIEDDIIPFGGGLSTIRYNLITLEIYHWDTEVINKALKEIEAPFRVVDVEKTNGRNL